MIARVSVARTILIVLFSFFATNIIAQPTLPDIAGTSERGVVILTWQCQYNGVKSIAVQRSSDSAHNFATVGYVKNLEKGVQAFVDGHPRPGKNYYQLYIVFSSDLTWNSNRLKLHIDSSDLENETMVLPPNDSLQRFLVMNDIKRPVKSKSGIIIKIDTSKGEPATTVQESIIHNAKDKYPNYTNKDNSDADAHITTATTVKSYNNTTNTTAINNNSTTSTSNDAAIKNETPAPPQPKPKITVSFLEDPSSVNPSTFIKARFVYTDPLTGYVTMALPDDVKTHHYSIKFYNQANHMIMEVPKINASKIIVDKRNFQQNGVYKFVLRKDDNELETGYITIY